MIACFATVGLGDIVMSSAITPANAAAIFLSAMFLTNAGVVFGTSAVMSQIYRAAPPGTEGVTSSLIYTCRMLFIASGTSTIVNVADSGRAGLASFLPLNRYGMGFMLTALLIVAGIGGIYVLRPRPQTG
jgi:hypothetical protein